VPRCREPARHGKIVAMAVGVRVATGVAVAAVLLSGCGSRAARETSSAPTSSAPHPTSSVLPVTPSSATGTDQGPRPSRAEVAEVATTLRRYLHAWSAEGPSAASRFLVPSQRTRTDRGVPRISAGTVTSYRLDHWDGPRTLTLLVSMDLVFANDPAGWNRGANDRFVTGHSTGDRGYLLELATSP